MRFGKARAIAVALAIAPACTIIIEPPPPPPAPVPVTFNPCVDSSDAQGMPTAHLLVDVRVDRTVVNLEEHYGSWMKTAVLGLWATRIRVTRAAMIQLEERSGPVVPLAAWGCDVGGFDLEPRDVLHYYATASQPSPANGCALTPLITAGEKLGELVTQYPPEIKGVSGRRIFGAAPDLVVVMHLDSLARKAGRSDSACADVGVLSESAESGLARWLNYPEASASNLAGVAPNRVFHWFIATDEGIDAATLTDRCRRVEGFPTSVLDVLEASPRALYQPVASELNSAGIVANEISLCRMFSDQARIGFFKDALGTISGEMGTTIDKELLDRALSGDLQIPGPNPAGSSGS